MPDEPRTFASSSPLIAADRVQGRPVYNRAGDKLGAVKDIFLDKFTGKVEFVTLAHGGILGAGAKVYPLPWQVLDFDPERGGFVVDLDKALLDTAPAYADEELETDTGWGARVRDFYRLPPMETFGGSAGV